MDMKKINPLIAINALFIILCASAFFYSNFVSDLSPMRQTQSIKKKKKNQEKRELELGLVKDQTTSVVNEPSALFNDPAIKQAWGLKKSDAARAWSITQGNKNTIIAVIDTGIDEKHEDLKNNLWTN